MNPENKCSHLYNQEVDKLPTIEEMFEMQKSLQQHLAQSGKALDPDDSYFMERINDISTQWRNLTLEFAELLERLPYKEWKNYDCRAEEGFLDDEHKLETYYEYIDMFHFFMNIGLCLGIDGKVFRKLYATKNKENFDRQKRGY